MGLYVSSGVCQRTAGAVAYIFRKLMFAADDALLKAGEFPQRMVKWLKQRRKLHSPWVGEEDHHCRAYNAAVKQLQAEWLAEGKGLPTAEQIIHCLGTRWRNDKLWCIAIYTDDCIIQSAGVMATIRALRCWGEVITRARYFMAADSKRNLGTALLTLGAQLFFDVGLVVIPQDKVLKALRQLNELLTGTLTFEALQSLNGLLEHLCILLGGKRSLMFGMFNPLRQRLGPADMVPRAPLLVKQATAWVHLLMSTAGCHFHSILPRAPRSFDTGTVFHLYSDAAKQGTPEPGIGGFIHGVHWNVPVGMGPLSYMPISHLEFIAAAANIIIFHIHFANNAAWQSGTAVTIAVHVDALATAQALTAASSSAPMMQAIHLALMQTRAFQELAGSIVATHAFGPSNVAADACSRGYREVFRSLCAQLQVTPVRIDVPAAVDDFINDIYTTGRHLFDTTGGTDGYPPPVHYEQQGPPQVQHHDEHPAAHQDFDATLGYPGEGPQAVHPDTRLPILLDNMWYGRGNVPSIADLVAQLQRQFVTAGDYEALCMVLAMGHAARAQLEQGFIFTPDILLELSLAAPMHLEWRPDTAADGTHLAYAVAASFTPAHAAPEPAAVALTQPWPPPMPPQATLRHIIQQLYQVGEHTAGEMLGVMAWHEQLELTAGQRMTDQGLRRLMFMIEQRRPLPPAGTPEQQRHQEFDASLGYMGEGPRKRQYELPEAPHICGFAPAALPPQEPMPVCIPQPDIVASLSALALRPSKRYRPLPANTHPRSVAAANTDALVAVLRADTTAMALRPGNWAQVGQWCDMHMAYHVHSVNLRTMRVDTAGWRRYWQPFCALMGTAVFRTDAAAALPGHPMYVREVSLATWFLMYVFERMRPRRHSDAQAKPASVYAVLLQVRRMHKRNNLGHCLVPTSAVKSTIKGMLKWFVLQHGHEALLPQRKEPIPYAVVDCALLLPQGTMMGPVKVNDSDHEFRSFHAFISTLKISGFRKADLAPSPGEPFGLQHISRASIVWIIDAVREITEPTMTDLHWLLTCTHIVYMAIATATMKNDQDGSRFGNSLIYVRLIKNDRTNAAWNMLQIEFAHPLRERALRKREPLFGPAPGVPFSHARLDALHGHMLKTVAATRPDLMAPSTISRYSLHSYRSALACALRSLRTPDGGRAVDDATIQAMCRWADPRSLKIYSRLGPAEYTSLLTRAASSTVDAIQASTLWRECPQVDDDSRFVFMEALSEAMATDTVTDDAQAEDTVPATTPAIPKAAADVPADTVPATTPAIPKATTGVASDSDALA